MHSFFNSFKLNQLLFFLIRKSLDIQKQQFIKNQMGRLKNLKEMIKQLDFFEHPQFFRYRDEETYRTLTGGIISLILIIAFAGVFTKLVINTFALNIITDSLETSIQNDPTIFSTSTNVQNRFMFAIGITGLDLNTKTNRFFNIIMQNRTYTKNGTSTIQKSIQIPLVQCTKDQWIGINSAIDIVYDTLGFNQWLCPPSNYNFQFQGKFTSNIFKFVKISIQACTPSANVTCANASTVDSFIATNQGLQANLYFVNPLINTGSQDYLDYYLQDRSYFTFSKITGISANVFFSEYQIDTDESILPWTDSHVDKGGISNEPPQSQTFAVTTSQYAKIYLRKSSADLSYTRSFKKIDDTLSYIGGLLATILGLLFIFKIYDKYCFEIEMGDRIFKENKISSFGSEKFDFINFLGYSFYALLQNLSIQLKWKVMAKFHCCREEAKKQLDVSLLFRKIQFFEHSLSVVLDKHHLDGLYLISKPTIEEAAQKRKVYMLNDKINQQLERKAHEVFIEDSQFNLNLEKFVNSNSVLPKDQEDDTQKHLRLQDQIFPNKKKYRKDKRYKKTHQIAKYLLSIKKSSNLGDMMSKKIYSKLQQQKSLKNIENIETEVIHMFQKKLPENLFLEDQKKVSNGQDANKITEQQNGLSKNEENKEQGFFSLLFGKK